MAPSGPSNTTKWWIGMLLYAIASSVGTALWINTQIASVAKASDQTVENHRIRELHPGHPSRDSFEAVKSEITEMRKTQDRMSDVQMKQDQLLQRVAEKLGVGR